MLVDVVLSYMFNCTPMFIIDRENLMQGEYCHCEFYVIGLSFDIFVSALFPFLFILKFQIWF